MENPEQQAHDLARERIAAAKAGSERALCLSPYDLKFDGKTYPGDKRLKHLTTLPPEIAGLTALQTLWLQETQVADIAPLARLTALHVLYLGGTKVADIAPLTGMTALHVLNLWRTQVTDIAPLAGLTALQTLNLENAQVADIAPLARLEKLRDLRFSNIPACAADPKLAELSEIEDAKERTIRTLSYLWGEEPIDEPELGEGSSAEAAADDEDATRPTHDQQA